MIRLLPALIVTMLASLVAVAHASPDCSGALAPRELADAVWLHRRNQNLHATHMVVSAAKKLEPKAETLPPDHKIAWWLRAAAQDRAAAKDFLYRAALTKRISPSFFELLKRLDVERGRSPETLSAEYRHVLERSVLADQRRSLELWADYLDEDAAALVPDWAKYWIVSSLVKLGPYNKAKRKFEARSRGQAALFPELDRSALAKVIDRVVRHRPQESFAAMYGREIERSLEPVVATGNVGGEWRRFAKGSDPQALIATLEGLCTGWCTVGHETAASQISKGDFHVYYSVDAEGRARLPRLAIRWEGERIVEVRGVGPHQEIDAAMSATNVLADKLAEFGEEGALFLSAERDMKRMTEIVKTTAIGKALSRDDLRFLYEIDAPIQGFGFDADPRIATVRAGRNARADLELVFEGVLTPRQISVTEAEALRGGIHYHYGNLRVDPRTLGWQWRTFLPIRISGNLKISGDISTNDLPTLPERIDGNLEMPNLTRIDDFTIRSSVGGSVDLTKLRHANRLVFAGNLNGDLKLNSITDVSGVEMPRRLRTLTMNNLGPMATGQLPARLDGSLILSTLALSPYLQMPEYVGKSVRLNRVVDARGVRFPAFVGGDFVASFLAEAKGSEFPLHIAGNLKIDGVKALSDLRLSAFVGEAVHVQMVERCRNVVFPFTAQRGILAPKLEHAEDCSNLR